MIPFHRDPTELAVVSVALNSGFEGGRVMFALDGEGVVCPDHLPGCALAHDIGTVHAVSSLTAGVRYNLFAISTSDELALDTSSAA